MMTAETYVASLSRMKRRVFLHGEQINEPTEHPLMLPSVRSVAETYRLAEEGAQRDLFVCHSPLIGAPVNRFTHIFQSTDDLLKKTRVQRVMGRQTGTCFQRCVGLDAINALFAFTHELDQATGSEHHQRLRDFVQHVQREDLVVCGAMTDAKGDRRQPPHAQPDTYLRVVEQSSDAIVVSGAKLHQTGALNSHEIAVMPGRALGPEDAAFAVSFAVPADAPGITYVYGRQPSDTRRLGPAHDQGNATYGGQEAIILFDRVEVPMDRVFMLGQTEHAARLVDLFAHHHRHSYGGCKSGNGDVLIGAAALIAQLNGVDRVSHVRDKLIEMVQLNETIFSCGLACAANGAPNAAGGCDADPLLANVCKQNVTRFPYEIARLAEDLAGGLLVTLPSAEDLEHPELGPQLEKLLAGACGSTADRTRVLRLIENMTLGSAAVAYRTESMHGAGSPQAQRVRMATQANMEEKINAARRLADGGGQR